MNTFYKALDIIKNRVQENPLVHTTIFARLDEKDLYAKQIYPLVHIIPQPAQFLNSQVTQFTFDVGAFEQRDINKGQTTDKFTGNDNVIDNLNLTSTILIDLISYLQTQNNDDNIEVVSIGNLTPIQYNDFNILDGWTVQITLQLPNDVITCIDQDSPVEPPTPPGPSENIPCVFEERFYYQLLDKFMVDGVQNNIKDLTSSEIIDMWLDNETYQSGVGQSGVAKCEEGLAIGDAIYVTSFDLNLLPSAYNGYWLADPQNEFITYGVIQEGELRTLTARQAPTRTSITPITITAVTPKIIKIVDGLITEIINLPVTGFING